MTREDAIFVLSCVEAHGLAEEARKMAIEALKAEPIKHGRWKVLASGNDAVCTNCKHYWIQNGDQYDYHYCPNCGARMDAQIGEDKSHPFAESVMMGMDEVEK